MAEQAPWKVEQATATSEMSGRDVAEPPRGKGGSSGAAGQNAEAPPLGQAAAGDSGPLLADAPLRLPHTDWLLHRMQVNGRASVVRAFQLAAAGAGVIHWQIDFDQLEEDWFHRLAEPARRTLSLQGARLLARQLREASERRHTLAVARVGRSRACLLDLHALIPVPPDILRLGPDHPSALAWLWEHWGTTEPLRQVALDFGKSRPGGAGRAEEGEAGAGEGGVGTLGLVFWSADWTPWRALAQLAADWPLLRFGVQPDYAAGQ